MVQIVEVKEEGALTPTKDNTANWSQTVRAHATQIIKGTALLASGVAGYIWFNWASSAEPSNALTGTQPNQPAPQGAASWQDQDGNPISNDIATSPASEFAAPTFDLEYVDGGAPKQAQATDGECNLSAVEDRFIATTGTGRNDMLHDFAPVDNYFVVAWDGNDATGSSNIYAQAFFDDGSLLGNQFLVNTYIDGSQRAPAVVPVGDGFAILWRGKDPAVQSNRDGVFGRCFADNRDPRGSEFPLHSTPERGVHSIAATAYTRNDGFMLAWTIEDSFSNPEIWGQRVDINCNLQGDNFLIAGHDEIPAYSFFFTSPVTVTLTDSSILIGWRVTATGDSSYEGGYVKRYTQEGDLIADARHIITGTTASGLSIAALNTGGFAATWVQNDLTGSGRNDIGVRLYDASGTPTTPLIAANSDTRNSKDDPAVFIFENDNFGVLWEKTSETTSGPRGLYSRMFTPSGNSYTPEDVQINNGTDAIYKPVVLNTYKNIFVALWRMDEIPSSSSSHNIYQKHFFFGQSAPTYPSSLSYIEDTLTVVPLTVNGCLHPVLPGQEQYLPLTHHEFTLTLSDASIGRLETNAEIPNDTQIDFEAGLGRFWVASPEISNINTVLAGLQYHPALNYDQDFHMVANSTDTWGRSYVQSIPVTGITVNSPPIITQNFLAIAPSGRVIFTADNLRAYDANLEDTLTFEVLNSQHIQFADCQDVTAGFINTFLAEWVTLGRVCGEHTGTENQAPSYDITVTDGRLVSHPEPVTVVFQSNDLPTIANNKLVLSQGDTVQVTPRMLEFTDDDDDDGNLLIWVAEANNGYFSLKSNLNVPVLSFKQRKIKEGELFFVHDDSTFEPDCTVFADDGRGGLTPHIGVNIDFNLKPSVEINHITINERDTTTVNANMLSAYDFDTPRDRLQFNITRVSNGYFTMTGSLNPIHLFNQIQIAEDEVQFTHVEGGAPSFDFELTDGRATISDNGFVVFNRYPQLITNRLTINQGGLVPVDENVIAADDPDAGSTDLSFAITGIFNGRFGRVSNPNADLSLIYLSQLRNGEIVFTHAGGEEPPAYNVSVSDGLATAAPAPATVDFNFAPQWLNNHLSVEQGASSTVESRDIQASDRDTSDLRTLRFSVATRSEEGFFFYKNKPSVPIESFTQGDIADGKVAIEHDGSEKPFRATLTISDARMTTQAKDIDVTFIPKQKNGQSFLRSTEGGLLVTAAAFAVTSLFGYAFWEHRNRADAHRKREKNPLANAVRSLLRLAGVDDFEREQGVKYTEAMTLLTDELIATHAINPSALNQDDFDLLTQAIADAIEPYLTRKNTSNTQRSTLSYYNSWNSRPHLKVDAVKMNISSIAAAAHAGYSNPQSATGSNAAGTMMQPLILSSASSSP